MATYARFEDLSGNPVFINAEQVTHLIQYSRGETQVYFGENHSITVKEEIALVAHQLSE